MPTAVRLTKKELIDLIESTEAASCDTSCLRSLLAEVEDEEEEDRRRRPPRRLPPPKTWPAEPTAQERLEVEVGHLFPSGVTDEVMTKLMEFDRDHTLEELRNMCVEAGLSPGGHKKELAAKLIAKGV